jgi:hypothetical protein
MPGPVDGTIEPQVDQQPQRSLVHRPQPIRVFGRIPLAREAIKPIDRAPSSRSLKLASGPEQDPPRRRCGIRADYASPAGGDGHPKPLFVSERALALTADDWLSEFFSPDQRHTVAEAIADAGALTVNPHDRAARELVDIERRINTSMVSPGPARLSAA